MAEKRELEIGRWYVPRKEGFHPRWLLAVYTKDSDGRERAIYSDGGIIHKHCLRSTFSAWVGTSQATVPEEEDYAVAKLMELKQELMTA